MQSIFVLWEARKDCIDASYKLAKRRTHLKALEDLEESWSWDSFAQCFDLLRPNLIITPWQLAVVPRLLLPIPTWPLPVSPPLFKFETTFGDSLATSDSCRI